jgi:hypothetical protein
MMQNTLQTIFNVSASINANVFLYYFKRIPLIGRIVPSRIYADISLKRNISIIAALFRIIFKFFSKALFIGLLSILAVMLMEKNSSLRYAAYLNVFFFLNAIGSFITSFVFETDQNKYICIRLMHINARNYIVSTLLLHEMVDFVTFLPAVMIATIFMGSTLAHGFILAVMLSVLSLTAETFFLLVYSGTGVMLSKKSLYIVCTFVLCLLFAYVPVLLHKPLMLSSLLFHPAFLLFLFLLLGCSLTVILKYDKYHELAMESLKASDYSVDVGKVITETKFSDVAVREKEFKHADLDTHRLESKTGFAYLNAIFFRRHRHILVKPIIIRLVIIAILFAVAAVASTHEPKVKSLISRPDTILPVFVFIMYFSSLGERVCKAMFYNCDISLLRYSFYREKNAVLSTFKVRLRRVAGLNLMIAFAIFSAVFGLTLVFGSNWSVIDTLAFALSILLLSLFFSVHHLFMYYVFQPYTTELGMKNPFYSGINSVIYFLCLFCMNIKSPPSYFTLIVLASTCLYIVVALTLVYRYAPKTFRVK